MKSLLEKGNFALGLVSGIISTLFLLVAFSYFEFAPFENPTIFGAIVGGAIAGAVSLIATIYMSQVSLTEVIEQKRVRDANAMYSIFVRVSKLHDSTVRLHRHLLDGDPRSFLTAFDKQQLKKPLIGIREPTNFSMSEKVLAFNIAEPWLFNSLNDCEGISSQMCLLQDLHEKLYFKIETALVSECEPSIDGNHVSVELSKSEAGAINLDILQLKDLEQHLRKLMNEAFAEVPQELEKITKLLETRYGTLIDIEIDASSSGAVYSENST